ncbi:hypothetical protein Hanom_Chr10g00892571 [Helianthus anomalus]
MCDQNSVYWFLSFQLNPPLYYLSADGEERAAGGIHENNLRLVTSGVIIDSKNKISFGIEDGKSIAIEEQRFLPNCEDFRVKIPPCGRRFIEKTLLIIRRNQ